MKINSIFFTSKSSSRLIQLVSTTFVIILKSLYINLKCSCCSINSSFVLPKNSYLSNAFEVKVIKWYALRNWVFLKSFDEVSDINSKYFSAVTGAFKPSEVFEAIKIASVDSVTENLLGSGIQSNVVNKLNDILIQNVTGSASYEDLVDQVRIFMTDTKEGDGASVPAILKLGMVIGPNVYG